MPPPLYRAAAMPRCTTAWPSWCRISGGKAGALPDGGLPQFRDGTEHVGGAMLTECGGHAAAALPGRGHAAVHDGMAVVVQNQRREGRRPPRWGTSSIPGWD